MGPAVALPVAGHLAGLRVAAASIVGLIEMHFAKEEQVQFPMAREVLSPESLAHVARTMSETEGG